MQSTCPMRVAVLSFSLLGAWSACGAAPVERIERGNLVLEDVPAIAPGLADKLERYLGVRQAALRDWTPEGGLLVQTRFADVDQVHLVERPLGDRRQITFSREPVSFAYSSPRGARPGFVYLADVGGNENAQIYFQPLDRGQITGEPRRLTDGKSLNGSVRWSNDGTRIAYYSNARGVASYDVYILDPLAGTPARIAVESKGNAWYPLDWSPDDSKLLLWNVVSINDSSLWVADLTTGALIPVEPVPDRRVGISAAAFSRDGKGVYVISDLSSEFRRLRYVPLGGGRTRVLTAHIPWDIESFDQSPDGRYLAYIANDEGYSKLTLRDLRDGKDLSSPSIPAGTISNLRFDGESRRLGFSLETARAPRDVYAYDIVAGRLEQWTQSEVGGLDRDRFVDAELIRFTTFDQLPPVIKPMAERIPKGRRGRMISGFLYTPPQSGPYPVLISIHGGPESQYRPEFDAFVQFAVNELGYAVIAPNVRGSSGYGKTFVDLDNGVRREDAVKDIGELLTWIERRREFDHKRVIVMGGSYGGYMTLASLVKYSDRLAGGIDTVGISNYISFLSNTSEYRRDLRRAEYGDERNVKMREFLHSISPLTNAERIRRPLLVVQGLNDPRVPASESEQMVQRIRANGGSVWYLMARDEGHGFKKKQNRDIYWETLASFLDRHGATGGSSIEAADSDR